MNNSLLIILILINFFCFSQKERYLVSSSGSIDSFKGKTIEWAIGEVISENLYFDNKVQMFTQGFFQGDDILNILSTKEELLFSIFPKPAKNKVWINIKREIKDRIKLVVYDVLGHLIYNNYYKTNFVELELSKFNQGIFTIIITDTKDNARGRDNFIVIND